MKRFRKIYVEISNICNLKCSFCPGTKSKPARMAPEQFAALLPKLTPYTDYLYFHLMGEPLCHPDLGAFLDLAAKAQASPELKILTPTGGQLLAVVGLLSDNGCHRVAIEENALDRKSVV